MATESVCPYSSHSHDYGSTLPRSEKLRSCSCFLWTCHSSGTGWFFSSYFSDHRYKRTHTVAVLHSFWAAHLNLLRRWVSDRNKVGISITSWNNLISLLSLSFSFSGCTDQSTYSRPTLSLQQATDLVEQLYGMSMTKMTHLPSYLDQNFRLECQDGKRYVLKIMNVEDSKNPSLLEMQTLAMSFLKQHGLPAQTVIPTTTGKLMSMEEIGKRTDRDVNAVFALKQNMQQICKFSFVFTSWDCGHGVQTYCVRLMNYIAGKTIAETPVTQKDLYEVGKLAATVDKTLQTVSSKTLPVATIQSLW